MIALVFVAPSTRLFVAGQASDIRGRFSTVKLAGAQSTGKRTQALVAGRKGLLVGQESKLFFSRSLKFEIARGAVLRTYVPLPLRVENALAPAQKVAGPDVEVSVTTLANEPVESIKLNGQVFNMPVRKDILHRVVVWLLAKARAGTAKTKTRSEICLTGKKLFKQKKTGNARHGSKSANIYVGGYKAFGPKPKDWAHDMNKKERRLALKMALSAKVAEGKVIVIDKAELDAPKTKELFSKLAARGIENALLVDKEIQENVHLAARNIPKIDAIPSQTINVYGILTKDTIVLTKAAVEDLEARLLAPIKR
eukprot:CAMPEP_0196666628 /NCGR_PEP_ID=MMETSP1086-20130531/64622_1 /TAXON_ID=77921 /ORGANISM="Cyanoptyche  gloeocystis , Strain SAG4.97" /LENGTH=309 /DNA_ID=CAMNT_0042003847 /DNA_START=106 /DNA_END=1035 /DNA_ORIENTATION=+